MSINRVIISGNLTRDSELRQTQSGMSVLSMGVAVNDRRKNQQTGEWEDYPNFIDCTMFGTRAQSLSNYLTKGTKVSVEGKLRWSQWEQDGQRRSKIEVVVDEIEFMSRDGSGSQPPYGGQGGYQQLQPGCGAQIGPQPTYGQQQGGFTPPYQPHPLDASANVYDSDIPF